MESWVPSVVVLGLAALAAGRLALTRPSPPERAAERSAAAWAMAPATALQCLHFVEEALSGFHERFPETFGLPPIQFGAFVSFNLACIVVWLLSIRWLARGAPAAFFAAWFLAIAGTINLIGHPLLALSSGKYFPGLWTAPFVGGACVLLGTRLRAATGPETIG